MLDITSPAAGFTSLYYERALAWYGWTPSRARLCVLPVVGRRHRSYHSNERCICETRFFDHARLWRDGNRTVFTFEPYGAVDLDLGDEFQVDELPRSMWWPGTTRLYAVTAR